MNELIKLVMAKTGISEAVAKVAIEVILGFIKDKLPKPIADQLGVLLGFGAASPKGEQADKTTKDDGFGMDDVLKGLGGMLGGK